jgi:hypothetical protein
VVFAEGCEVGDDEGMACAGDVAFACWVERCAGERDWRPLGVFEMVLDVAQVLGVPRNRVAGLGCCLKGVV